MAPRMAWHDSGAGMIPSVREKRTAASKQASWLHRLRLDDAGVDQLRDQRRSAMVAQAAGVDPRRHEVVAEGEHLRHRRHFGGVAVVEGVDPPRQGRAARRLQGHDPDVLTVGLVGDEGEGDPGEIGAAAVAADDHVRIVADQGELLLGLQADHRLVQADMVEDAAQGVAGVLTGGGVLHRFADGDPERAVALGVLFQDRAAGVRLVRRRGDDVGPPQLHHALAVRLLVDRRP